MSSYIVVTVYMNEWRKKFRRDMIEADNAANDRSVNSLINFETVKVLYTLCASCQRACLSTCLHIFLRVFAGMCP